jgi:WD40 repeat protein
MQMKQLACLVAIIVLLVTGTLNFDTSDTLASIGSLKSAKAAPQSAFTATPSAGKLQIGVENAGQLELLFEARGDPIGEVKALAWTPDGKQLVVAGTGGTALLHGETLEPLEELSIAGPVSYLAFSNDGKRLAAGGFSIPAQVWDVHQKKLLRSFHGAGSIIAISQDGKRLAAAEDDLTPDNSFQIVIQVFNIDTGKLVSKLKGLTPKSVWNDANFGTEVLAFSPDGRSIQVANTYGDVRMWDINSGRLVNTSLNGHTRSRLSVGTCQGYGGSGRTFALACMIGYLDPPCSENEPGCNPTPRVRWDVGLWETNQIKRSNNFIWRDSSGSDHRLLYDASKRSASLLDWNDRTLYRISPSGKPTTQTISALHAAQWQTVMTSCKACPLSLALHPNGETLAIGRSGWVVLTDLKKGEIVKAVEYSTQTMTSAAIGVIGRKNLLGVGISDGSIRLLNPATGAEQKTIAQAHTRAVTGLAFTDNGLISVGGGGKVRLWSPDGSKEIRSFDTEYLTFYQYGYRFVYNQTAGLLLVDSKGKLPPEVVAYDVRTGTEKYAWIDKASALAFSRDGRWLAAGRNQQATIMNATNGKVLRDYNLGADGQWLDSVALSPDGSLLAAVVNGGAVVLDVNTRQEYLRTQEADGYFTRVAFAPSGCLLALGSRDGDIVLVDAGKGTFLSRQAGHTGAAIGIEFSADGRLLVSTGVDRTARIWGMAGGLDQPPGQPAPQTCRFASLPAASTPTPTAIPATPTPTPAPVVFTRNLLLTEPAMRGNDVLLLQQRLYELGYVSVGQPDGLFGKKTGSAVRAFQQHNGLVVDGIVGQITWTRLFSKDAIRQ